MHIELLTTTPVSLQVIEAMTCGLPTFATNRGGPAEIIEDGKSGTNLVPLMPSARECSRCTQRAGAQMG